MLLLEKQIEKYKMRPAIGKVALIFTGIFFIIMGLIITIITIKYGKDAGAEYYIYGAVFILLGVATFIIRHFAIKWSEKTIQKIEEEIYSLKNKENNYQQFR